MKRSLIILIAMVAAVALQAQTADEIITKYYENTGGIDNWKTLKATKMVGLMSMGGMEFMGTIYNAAPNRMRVEVDVQGQQIVQAYDGETAWWINPFMGSADPQKMPADMAEQMTEEEFEAPFINYKEKGNTVELVGDADVEGTPTFEIKLTKKNGDVEFYYFEKENFVPIMVKKTVKSGQMKGQFSETYLSDYQEVGSLIFPHFMDSKMGGQSVQKITIKSIELNPAVEDAFFSMPKK